MLSTLSDSPTRGPLLSGPSYFIPIPAFGANSSDLVRVYTSVSPGPEAPPGPGGMDHKPTHVLTQQPRKKTCFVPITVTHGAPQTSPSNCQLAGTAAVRISVKPSTLTFQIFTLFLLFGPVLRSPQTWDVVGVSEIAGVTAVGTRPSGTPRHTPAKSPVRNLVGASVARPEHPGQREEGEPRRGHELWGRSWPLRTGAEVTVLGPGDLTSWDLLGPDTSLWGRPWKVDQPGR